MSAPRLVGLIGKKRSGKDTFASGLIEGQGFSRFSFADIMKTAALMADPYVEVVGDYPGAGWEPVRYVRVSALVRAQGWEKAKEQDDVRRYLQRFGTEVGRNLFGENFWVDRTMAEIADFGEPSVITDVRFPNEAAAINAASGTLVRITRPGNVSTDTHPSETALDDYPADLTIENSGTAEDLTNLARTLQF